MAKPIVIINPVTGERSFTKHPERLSARSRVEKINGVLFGYLRPTLGYGIVIANRWSMPHTKWECGALYEPDTVPKEREQKRTRAYEQACEFLGCSPRPGEVVS